MSVSHCMHLALAIADKPRAEWGDRIAQLPDACEHSDCGTPKSCRQRIAEYMRVQYKIQARRDARAAKAQGSLL